MTDEKARDFFSAYYEGTLESGLSMSFEQKLKADWSLNEEYSQFVRAMDELGTLKFEEIDIPHDLQERISARIDRDIYERKHSGRRPFLSWARGLAYAGIGALAITGAFFALNSHSPTQGAGFAPSAIDRIDYAVSANGVTLRVAPASPKSVVIRNQGREVSRAIVGPTGVNTVLSNPNANAAVFEIALDGVNPSFMVVPGRVRSAINAGSGSFVQLAQATSDFYRLPVLLETKDSGQRTSWTFGTSDAVSEVAKALGPSYSVTLLQSGILEIKG